MRHVCTGAVVGKWSMIRNLADDIKTFRAVDLILGVITRVVVWA